MPSRKAVKKAIRRGTNPYAVANAMKKKRHLSAKKVEKIVKAVTKRVNKGKKK